MRTKNIRKKFSTSFNASIRSKNKMLLSNTVSGFYSNSEFKGKKDTKTAVPNCQ